MVQRSCIAVSPLQEAANAFTLGRRGLTELRQLVCEHRTDVVLC